MAGYFLVATTFRLTNACQIFDAEERDLNI